MRAPLQTDPRPDPLDALRTELPDLAYDLERQGRLDAADVVMMLHARLRELAAEQAEPGQLDATIHPTVSLQFPS